MSMPQDQQTYRRATGAAMIGLVVQFVMTVTFAVLGLWAQSSAIQALTWHLLGGLPIWLVLAMVYHQHRLERIEALETERLARTSTGSSDIFTQHADDLAVARKRLDMFYKWGLNLVALGVAVYLIALGLLLTGRAIQAGADPLGHQANLAVLMTVNVGAVFIMFIVTRYVAGMTRVPQWLLLRGGATYLMSNFLAAILVLGGIVAAYFGQPAALGYVAIAVPVLMTLMGIEIVLLHLLGAYRPRRPGEIPRPAFDSRLFGFLTSPESLAKILSDTINYQFGFEVSKSWFYRLLGRAVTPLVALALVLLVLLSSIVIVGPHQRAIITRFGAITQEAGPGLTWKWPWPMGRAHLYDVQRVHKITVGSITEPPLPGVAILWTTEHAEDERFLITAPTPLHDVLEERWPGARQHLPDDAVADPGVPDPDAAPGQPQPEPAQRGGDAGDMALVAAEVTVQYRIADLDQFVRTSEAPVELLRMLADRRVTQYFASYDIDTLLAVGRIEAGDWLMKRIAQDVQEMQLGIKILHVAVTGIHPPQAQEVAHKFHEQVGAEQERAGMIQEAHRQRIQVLSEAVGSPSAAEAIIEAIGQLEALGDRLRDLGPELATDDPQVQAVQRDIERQQAQIEQLLASARGQAAALIHEARAQRWDQVLEAQARALDFSADLVAFELAPNYFVTRRFYDAMSRGMAGARKFIVPPGIHAPVYRLDLTEQRSLLPDINDR